LTTGSGTEGLGFSYDAAGALGSVVYPSYSGETNPTATYAYNDIGQMESVTDWSGNKVAFANDSDGNETLQADEASTANPNGLSSMTTSYDLADRATQVGITVLGAALAIDPNSQTSGTAGQPGAGLTFSQATAENGLPESATPSGSCSPTWYTYTFNMAPSVGGSRNAAGQDTSTGLSNIDSCGDVGGTLAYYYGYDPAGRVTWSNTASEGSSPPLYTYDGAGDMTTYSNTMNGSGLPDSYNQTFDTDDELLTSVGDGTTTTYGYDTLGDQVSTTAGSSTTTASYDTLGQMVGSTTGSTSETLSYNGDGLETSRTLGSSTEDLLWATEGSLPSLFSDGSDYFIYGPNSTTPVEQYNVTSSPPTSNPTFINYVNGDGLSNYGITNTSGDSTNWITYDPYGNHASIVFNGTVFGYAGQFEDIASGGTGLYNMRARWYQPSTGTFTSVDPALLQTDEPYEYAGDDPVNETDPSGEYTYNYQEDLGDVTGPIAAMTFFENHLQQVFPFSTGTCEVVQQNEQCEFAAVNWGPIHFDKGPIEFTFANSSGFQLEALSGHLDPAGSKITFSTFQAGCDTYLTQEAWAPAGFVPTLNNPLPLFDLWFPAVAKVLWAVQAENLSYYMGGTYSPWFLRPLGSPPVQLPG
jgi:RHS repeat-associated protein